MMLDDAWLEYMRVYNEGKRLRGLASRATPEGRKLYDKIRNIRSRSARLYIESRELHDKGFALVGANSPDSKNKNTLEKAILYNKGMELCQRAKLIRLESNMLKAESSRLGHQKLKQFYDGTQLMLEGKQAWLNAILIAVGNTTISWTSPTICVLGVGKTFIG